MTFPTGWSIYILWPLCIFLTVNAYIDVPAVAHNNLDTHAHRERNQNT